jgi:type VI secretion system secreted protein Hcp
MKFETQEGKHAPGESQTTGHAGSDGWVDISDWSFDVEAEASHLKGTGAAVGKPSFNALSLTHFYDKSSPVIMTYIVKGNHFKSVTLHLLKQTGGDKPELFFELLLKDAFITKVSNKGGEDGSVSQDVELVYKQIILGYKQQNNDGSLGKTKPFGWNVGVMNDKTDVKLSI